MIGQPDCIEEDHPLLLDDLDSPTFSESDAIVIAGSAPALPPFLEPVSIIVKSGEWSKILRRCLNGDVTLIRVVIDADDPAASFPYAPSRRDARELAKQFERNVPGEELTAGPRRFEVGEDVVNTIDQARGMYDSREAVPPDAAVSLRGLSQMALHRSLERQSRPKPQESHAAAT
jgi:hypothetical protein